MKAPLTILSRSHHHVVRRYTLVLRTQTWQCC